MTHKEFSMDGHGYAKALRQIADWYDEHPDVPFTHQIVVGGVQDTKEAAAAIARALGRCAKRHTESLFTLVRSFSGIDLTFHFWRSAVCERVVVGTKVVPEHTVPETIVEEVTWRCEPMFAETDHAQ